MLPEQTDYSKKWCYSFTTDTPPKCVVCGGDIHENPRHWVLTANEGYKPIHRVTGTCLEAWDTVRCCITFIGGRYHK